MGQIGCPETSVTNHQPTPRNIAEDRLIQLHLDGSLKARRSVYVYYGRGLGQLRIVSVDVDDRY